MSRQHDYRVTVRWSGDTGAGYRDYVRDHDAVVEGKPVLKGTADPAFFGTPERWNPEELLVASLSECHMLTFLSLCARAGIVVTGYVDAADGVMREEPGNSGRFTEVVLRPQVTVADHVSAGRTPGLARPGPRTRSRGAGTGLGGRQRSWRLRRSSTTVRVCAGVEVEAA